MRDNSASVMSQSEWEASWKAARRRSSMTKTTICCTLSIVNRTNWATTSSHLYVVSPRNLLCIYRGGLSRVLYGTQGKYRYYDVEALAKRSAAPFLWIATTINTKYTAVRHTKYTSPYPTNRPPFLPLTPLTTRTTKFRNLKSSTATRRDAHGDIETRFKFKYVRNVLRPKYYIT